MPLVPKSSIEALHTQNEALATELADFEEMRPHLALATEIRSQIMELLDRGSDFTASQIGDMAFRLVLEQRIDEAREEVVARYEQAHRRILYERLVQEVEVTEGEQILKDVQQQVETDPELAQELRESARRELAARATSTVRQQISEEQAAIIEQEAERQIDLDRLDVELAVEGELDLNRSDIVELIKPGDKVDLFFKSDNGQRKKLTLTWTKDAKGNEGWLYSGAEMDVFDQRRYRLMVDSKQFVVVGTLCSDLKNGTQFVGENLLTVDAPLVFLQNKGGKTQEMHPHVRCSPFGYSTEVVPFALYGSDFQTKDLNLE